MPDNYPSRQIILGRWSESPLFHPERLASLGRATQLQRPSAAYFQQNLCVAPSGRQAYRPRSPEPAGPERPLFSTD
ncbi:hypothetical protein [Hymenobacter bucti]|uniref:Uncharacterized protein n=1 Tax=Hymenobacter bucti TaxID=1844114 RepID=A0ABW4QTU6_9BACT